MSTVDDLRRIGSSQAGALKTEDGEVWHPANLLLPAANEIEELREKLGAVINRPSGKAFGPAALEAMEARRLKSQSMIRALCLSRGTAGAREWLMSIPADAERDPDLILSATCDDVGQLLVAVVFYLLPIVKMAKQAYEADAVAEWFDEDGDGLKSLLDAYDRWASGEGE